MQTIDFLDQLFVLTERIIIITHFTSSQYWLIPEKQSLQCNANIFCKGKQENTFPVCWVIIKISPLTGRGRAWEMSPTVNITLYQDIIHWPNLHYKLYQYPAPLRLSERAGYCRPEAWYCLDVRWKLLEPPLSPLPPLPPLLSSQQSYLRCTFWHDYAPGPTSHL